MKKFIAIAASILVIAGCGVSRKTPVLQEHQFPSLKQDGRTSIVAHRGFWKCEAAGMSQNSIASVGEAVDNAFWGSECDIHLTSDDVIIVNHDNSIDGLSIRNHTFAELSSHLLPNGERRPSFDEYLDRFARGADRTTLVIEFKGQESPEREDELVSRAFDALKAHGLYDPSKVAFISFSHHMCRQVAKLAPEFVNQYLNGDIAPAELANEGINGIDYHGPVFHRHPEWVKEAHDLGMSVNVWTIDSPAEMDYMTGLGVDAITTNEPLLARERLGKKEFRKDLKRFRGKKLVCLDLDATLTRHRTALEQFNRDALDSLGKRYSLVMVCAGNAQRVWEQMGRYPIDILGNYGMQEARVENGELKMVRQTTVPADTAFFMAKTDYLRRKYGYTEYYGDPVEFHQAGMVTFGLLGTAAPIGEKLKFDPDRAKRRAMYPEVLEIFKDYAVYIGGSSSFDFAPAQFNKYDAVLKYASEHGYTLDEIIFIGDDFDDGGSDSHIRIKGMDYICIDDYHNFPKMVSPLLGQE